MHRTHVLRPRTLLLGSLLVALLLALVPQADPAAAAGTGTIKGTVGTKFDGPARHGMVDVYDDSTSPPTYVTTVTAKADGTYSVALEPGLYGIVFYNSDDGGANYLEYFPELYKEQPLFSEDPTLVKLGEGETKTVNARLAPLFEDMFDTPFTDDIGFLRNTGTTVGCNPPTYTRFCTEDSVTRGQMAAFLVRFLGLTKIDPSIEFDDIDDSIYKKDILRLATADITRGCNPEGGNTKFCPNDRVTRGQMAAFLVRAFGMKKIDSSVSFEDTGESIFERDIYRLATAKVTRGCNPAQGNTRFCPNDAVTRGQMAAFLFRAFEWDTSSGSAGMSAEARRDAPARADLTDR